MARSRLPPKAVVATILILGVATFLIGMLLPVYYWSAAGVQGDEIDTRDYTEGDTLLLYGKAKYVLYTQWSHSTKVTLHEGNFTFVVPDDSPMRVNLTGREIYARIVLGQSHGSGWYADEVLLVDEANDSFKTIAIAGAGIAILGAVLGTLRMMEIKREKRRALARNRLDASEGDANGPPENGLDKEDDSGVKGTEDIPSDEGPEDMPEDEGPEDVLSDEGTDGMPDTEGRE